VIPIDSIYAPVTRVRYRTENTRVGQLTDYDRLILEVWTDGSLHPELALVEAGKILRKHLVPFVNYTTLGTELAAESFDVGEATDEAGAESSDPAASPASADADVDQTRSVRDLGLSVRALNSLEGNGIETLSDLVGRSAVELLELRNFGKTTLKEVQAKMWELGLSLGGDVEEAGAEIAVRTADGADAVGHLTTVNSADV
jgi:DNA-directed RNA polymerase subunit alpha